MSEMLSTPEQLFTAQHSRLLGIALHILRNREDAEDCVQEAFLDICAHWGQRDPAKTVAWASSVVWNQALELLRKRRARSRIPPGLCGPIDGNNEPAVASHEARSLARLIVVRAVPLAGLSPRQRTAFETWASGELKDTDSPTKLAAHYARAKIRAAIG